MKGEEPLSKEDIKWLNKLINDLRGLCKRCMKKTCKDCVWLNGKQAERNSKGEQG